ncbi:MAG: hypothetical protein PVF13_02910 [Chromatiales bacterium]|jgi:hypothetical protein
MSEEQQELKEVNGQVVDAVRTSTGAVMGAFNDYPDTSVAPVHGTSTVYANTIAYPKVSQAAAFAVQDATDYLRNIMTMSTTAQGVIFKLMVENEVKAPLYIPILQQMQAAVAASQENLEAVGKSAAAVLSGFEKSS